MHPLMHNIGAFIDTNNVSHVPLANAAGARNGTGMEILGTRSIVLNVNVGATTGTPDSFSIIYKLQDSTDGSSYSDATDVDGNAVTLTITAASAAYEKDVDLARACRAAATHVRWVETVAFVGGTSPTVLSGATIIKGPGQSLAI